MEVDAQNKAISPLLTKMTPVTQQVISGHNIIETPVSTMSDHVIGYRFGSQAPAVRRARFDDSTEGETEAIVILRWGQSSV